MNKQDIKEKIGELPTVDAVFKIDGQQFIDTAVQIERVYDFIDELEEYETLSQECIDELELKYKKELATQGERVGEVDTNG